MFNNSFEKTIIKYFIIQFYIEYFIFNNCTYFRKLLSIVNSLVVKNIYFFYHENIKLLFIKK